MQCGDGWVLRHQDGFGLTLEPGLAFRRGGPRFEGEASGCLPFSFQRLLGQRGGGGSGGGRGRRRGKRGGTGGCRPSVHLSTRSLDRRMHSWGGQGPQAQGLASDVRAGRGRLGRKGRRETLTPSTEKGVPEKGPAGNVNPINREGGAGGALPTHKAGVSWPSPGGSHVGRHKSLFFPFLFEMMNV